MVLSCSRMTSTAKTIGHHRNSGSSIHLMVEFSLQHPQQSNGSLCLNASSDTELTTLLEVLLKLLVALRT